MKLRVLFIILLFLNSISTLLADGGEKYPQLKTPQKELKAWQDMRFGMFIHWGPVTERGTELSWSRGMGVAVNDYDNLYKGFNPSLFNAKEWVSAAKEAGMKYLVITARHHDGFCLWDTKTSDYDILNTPFKRDVLKELQLECEKQGILFCTYYSILDWRHPDYPVRHGGDAKDISKFNMDIFNTYVKDQLKEIITGYRANLLWFDGEWESPWTHEMGMDLYAYCRSLNNNILINNRIDKGRDGMKGVTMSDKYAGDYGTPEQQVGNFDNDHPWESCITIGTQWSWKPNDNIKTRRECLQTLVRSAGGGGNLLFNVGPMMDGRIEGRQLERLSAIGAWMKVNGESIYGTKGGPFLPNEWMVSTHKGNNIFVQLMELPDDMLKLPAIPGKDISAVQLMDGTKISFKKNGNDIWLDLPASLPDPDVNVLVITLNGSTEEIKPMPVQGNLFRFIRATQMEMTNPASGKYPASGIASLTDGIRGSNSYSDGNWLGFEGTNLEVIIDLKDKKTLNSASVGCLQDQNSWIFLPEKVEAFISQDKVNWKKISETTSPPAKADDTTPIRQLSLDLKESKGAWLKIIVHNVGQCPDWHKGKGGKAWLFVDELIVE